MDKRTILVAGAVVGGIAGISALAWFLAKRSRAGKTEEASETVADLPSYGGPCWIEETDVPRERDGEPVEFVPLERPDDSEMIVPDEKPKLADILEGGDAMEVRFEGDRKEIEDAIGKTRYGTEAVHFDDAGHPVFTLADWESEVGNIDLISREEYHGDNWAWYDRKVAVWFPDEGVLADDFLEPMEVVDTIGPLGFSQLMKDPEGVVYCKNEELETCYEISVNENPFEKALADAESGVIFD